MKVEGGEILSFSSSGGCRDVCVSAGPASGDEMGTAEKRTKNGGKMEKTMNHLR